MMTCHPEKVYPCNLCQKVFLSKLNLTQHQVKFILFYINLSTLNLTSRYLSFSLCMILREVTNVPIVLRS